MRYQDFTVVIAESMAGGYPVSAVSTQLGRVSVIQVPPDAQSLDRIREAATLSPMVPAGPVMRAAGVALFRWLFQGPVETHLRVAWDRAQRAGDGLRLRLSVDPPEVAVWPWELLQDPARDLPLATSPSTLLVRFFDQAERFGVLLEQQTHLPLDVLVVLPQVPDLDLAQERQSIETVVGTLTQAVRLRALEGIITRADLADALLKGDYDVIHFGGHGVFQGGQGYVGLNRPDGSLDWVHGEALARLVLNYKSVKLVVLNGCSTGKLDGARAFQGLAPQLVRYGVPAVLAMQYPVSDAAAITFAHEFYKRLCIGEDAGQVDVAVTYARGMVSVLHPGDPSWAAPVLYTHSADGVICSFPDQRTARDQAAVERKRLLALTHSLRASQKMREDWRWAAPDTLLAWRDVLWLAEDAYRTHASDGRPEVRKSALQGLMLVQGRLSALEQALVDSGAAAQSAFPAVISSCAS